jgi:hypothetical protein
LGVKSAPRYTIAELRAAIDQTKKALLAWQHGHSTATEEAKKQLARGLNQAFAQLSETTTFADASDPQQLEQSRLMLVALLAKAAADQEVLKLIAAGGAASWKATAASRSGGGIAVVGSVQSIQNRGQLFETRLAPESGPTEITVVSVIDPRGHFQVGSRLLVLGAIVEEPQKTFVGYAGDEPRVIFGGFPYVLPVPRGGRQL